MSVLICSAIEEELDRLKPHFETCVLGIGLVEATVSLTDYLRSHEVSTVIFTGTAGAYPSSGYQIGDCVTSSKFKLVGSASALEQAYFPEKMSQALSFNEPSWNTLPNVVSGTVVEITKSLSLSEKIASIYNVDVEHMEVFGLASVCKRFNTEFFSVFGISNCVYEKSHIEWVTHNRDASLTAQNYIHNCKKYFL